MEFSLYHSPWCPFCVRVIVALKSMPSLDVQLRDINSQENYLALKKGGGKTQVPCLLIENNGHQQWMYESFDIINYLKSQ